MRFFDLNAPGTTGYTVALDGKRLAMVHAHGFNHDAWFYRAMDACHRRLTLIYLPIDDGEYVTEICRLYDLDPIRMAHLGIAVSAQISRCS